MNVGKVPTFFCSWGVPRLNMNEALEVLVRTEVEGLGFDLVEFRKGGTARSPLLDVRIDRLDGARITIDECAHVSRALEPRLDASGLVGENYVLEVSSPGVERPLRASAVADADEEAAEDCDKDARGGEDERQEHAVEGVGDGLASVAA